MSRSVARMVFASCLALVALAAWPEVIVLDSATLPAIHKAAFEARQAAVEDLLQKGSDVNAKGPHDWTPLHLAALGGHQALCEMLLGQGADPLARDDRDRTPAQLAKEAGHDGTAAFLASKSASQQK